MPDLETTRLRLRNLTLGDTDFVVELLNEPSFLRYIGDRNVRDRASACRYLEAGPFASYARFGFGLMCVELKPGAAQGTGGPIAPAAAVATAPAAAVATAPPAAAATAPPAAVPIGICGLLKRDTLEDVDVGFAFLPRYWGKGYAFEAAEAVLAQGRERFGLNRIVAITSPDNEASIRLLEKLGFRFERVMRLTPEADEVKLFGLERAGAQ